MRGLGGGKSKGRRCSTQAVSYVSRGRNRMVDMNRHVTRPLGIKTRGPLFWFSFKSFTTTALSLIKDYQLVWYLFLERGPIRRGRATRSTFEAFCVTPSPKFAIDLVSTHVPCQRDPLCTALRGWRPERPYSHHTCGSTSTDLEH